MTGASATHPKAVVGVALAVTAVLGLGLTNVELRSADYDLMPTWHPSYEANEVALQRIPGFRSIETVYLELSPEYKESGCGGFDVDNWCMTNPPVIRAIEEANRFLIEATNAKMRQAAGKNVVSYEYSLAYLIKLVNYSVAINPVTGEKDRDAFALPADDTTLNTYYNALYEGARPAIEGILNDDGSATILVFMYDLETTKAGPERVLPASKAFLDTVLEYRAFLRDGESETGAERIFNTEHVYVLGELINAHSTDLAKQDFERYLPLVFLFILGVMMIVFRRLRMVAVAFTTLTIGIVWTYGLMGWLEMPLDFFSMLIVPVSLGAGVDYTIHAANEYMVRRGEGRDHVESVRLMGATVGAALVITAVTTIAGFLTMVPSSFLPMINLGILGAFLFVVLLVTTLTLGPALMTLLRWRDDERALSYAPSRGSQRVARFFGRNKAVAAGVFLVAAAVLIPNAANLTPYFEISGGFREGDYVRESYEYYNAHWGGAGTELLTIVPPAPGDVADPVTMEYIAALDNEFKHNLTEIIPRASNVNSLRIAIDTYETLKGGLATVAGTVVLKEVSGEEYAIPETREGVLQDIREMYADPVFASLAALFVDEEATVAVNHIFYEIHGGTFADLENAWVLMNEGIDNAERASPPIAGTKTDLVGTQDTFYLYVKHGYPWIGYVMLLSTLAVIVLIGATLGRARDLMVVAIPMVATTGLWLGVLPYFGVELSLTLMLPIIFITAIGSDFAVQFVWNIRKEGDPNHVFGTIGKGVLFSAISTVGAFLIFSRGDLILASQSALATALAIVVIYLVTMVVVPPFYYKREPRSARKGRGESATPGETP